MIDIKYVPRNGHMLLEQTDLPIDPTDNVVSILYVPDEEIGQSDVKLFKVVSVGADMADYNILISDIVILDQYVPLPRINGKQFYIAHEGSIQCKVELDKNEEIF